ncbi:MAG: RNA-binding S4 domain-containing protein [Verrucomicrobiales bacterium]|nr:RNA-binding S4 domain-containing protein [Verrucomicrobiales bacterium]
MPTSPKSPPPALDGVRIDVWMWAVRLFKTRDAAAQACRNSRVLILDQPVKPSRLIRPGDLLDLLPPSHDKLVRVKKVLNRRVGAPKVPEFLNDETPPERRAAAAARQEALRLDRGPVRVEGSGRPTKKDRRQLDHLMEEASNKEQGLREFVRRGLRKGRDDS